MATGMARLRIAGPTSLTRLMESSLAGADSAGTVGVPAAAGMVADGWVDEVRALRRLPHPVSREAAQALGYKELFAFLDGRVTLEEAIELIQKRSRNFAKRQLTWFRQLPECWPTTWELTFSLWGLRMGGER